MRSSVLLPTVQRQRHQPFEGTPHIGCTLFLGLHKSYSTISLSGELVPTVRRRSHIDGEAADTASDARPGLVTTQEREALKEYGRRAKPVISLTRVLLVGNSASLERRCERA